ncbi:Uncharacterised protein [uncultured archaeon]|nr:Uncharacterised protein [uncultured archaeon]
MDVELRKDFLLDRWVLIATGRAKRPQHFTRPAEEVGKTCFFCPGRENETPAEIMRVEEDGRWVIRVFPNKYPAVDFASAEPVQQEGFTALAAKGVHEVIVETPEHTGSIADLPLQRVVSVLNVYKQRIKAAEDAGSAYAALFKNSGSEGGASLPHSHTQLISLPHVPRIISEEAKESIRQKEEKGKCPFCELMDREKGGLRCAYADDEVMVLAPYAPRFHYETWIIPKRHVLRLDELTDKETEAFAKALKNTLTFLKKEGDLPYNFILHQSPNDADLHLHLEIYPRIAQHAGFEMGGGDYITSGPPEATADSLRPYFYPSATHQ